MRADDEALSQLGCLPLAERNLTLGQQRPRLLAVGILAACIVVIAARLSAPDREPSP